MNSVEAQKKARKMFGKTAWLTQNDKALTEDEKAPLREERDQLRKEIAAIEATLTPLGSQKLYPVPYSRENGRCLLLVLTRFPGEEISIPIDLAMIQRAGGLAVLTIKIVEVRDGGRVHVGIDAPREIPVHRGEKFAEYYPELVAPRFAPGGVAAAAEEISRTNVHAEERT